MAKKYAADLMLTGHKLIHHIDELTKWKNNEMFAPIFIEFGPTNFCNHRCLHCYVQDLIKKPTAMKGEVYLRTMREIGEYGVKAVVLGGCGEPMLHKATPEAIKIAVKHGTDVSMLSNVVAIKDKDIPVLMDNLTFLRITVNGFSQETYSKLHNCAKEDWKKLKENMKKLSSYRNKNNARCTLGVYTIIYDESLPELEDAVKEIKDMGFDYMEIKPPLAGLQNIQHVRAINLDSCKSVFERVMKMSDSDFRIQIREDLFLKGCVKNYKKCYGLPFACVIDADGSVCACNWFWGQKEFLYGNLNKNSFKEIWEGERKAKIIEWVQSDDFDIAKCGSCKQNVINAFLWELANPPEHVNFI